MTPEQIRELRSQLRCTARELAATLDVPLAEVQAWEASERFPTKRLIERLQELRSKGPDGVVRKSRKTRRSAMEQLDDPELWRLFRKLLTHPELCAQAMELAQSYEDPLSSPKA